MTNSVERTRRRRSQSLLSTTVGMVLALWSLARADTGPVDYFKLSEPQPILEVAQEWEGDEQPHTLSVLELNRGGYKYWGWYGLNKGRGIGLARSNDLVHWTKYDKNPLWLNARWPSALQGADPANPKLLHFAITRNYDTPTSHIVLATSEDGIHLTEVGKLAQPVQGQRNQNPNLFQDPVSGKVFLTFYRGNDRDSFDIVSKSAKRISDLASAPEKVLMHTTETIAAPTLIYVPKSAHNPRPLYYLATEIYPGRYSTTQKGVWQVKVFYSDAPDGHFEPTAGNPVQDGERACLFQHKFNDTFYGYQCRLDTTTQKWGMELVTAPWPK